MLLSDLCTVCIVALADMGSQRGGEFDVLYVCMYGGAVKVKENT
jgi:hypothetical protein